MELKSRNLCLAGAQCQAEQSKYIQGANDVPVHLATQQSDSPKLCDSAYDAWYEQLAPLLPFFRPPINCPAKVGAVAESEPRSANLKLALDL